VIEAGVVVGLDGSALHWHLPADRSTGALPDSPDLWEVLWSRRQDVLGFAHSHPGAGQPGPSWTDLTTFAAIEAGLGRRLIWWITSADRLIALRWRGPGQHDYEVESAEEQGCSWLHDLRRFSVR
jgi:proteasome lid subunit RPN8/RPN11